MREIEATLEAAIAAGVNLFDTADIYGQGDRERALGRLLGRYRDLMFVTTKIGFTLSPPVGAIRIAKPLLRALVQLRPRGRETASCVQESAHLTRISPSNVSIEQSMTRFVDWALTDSMDCSCIIRRWKSSAIPRSTISFRSFTVREDLACWSLS